MCGIAGVTGPRVDVRDVEAMLHAIAHRGEPAYRCEIAQLPHGTIGAARLAIVDEPHGRQPFAAGDSDGPALVMNGEIYNAPALRRDLSSSAPFVTDCDTEVALRAYVKWGPAFVERLRGMFAIAVLDGDSLLLARDPLGIKPLYVSSREDMTWFGSELKAVVLGPTETIEEVGPGTVWHDGVRQKYWSVPPFDDGDACPPGLLDHLDRTLRRSVLSHLPPTGRLACLLSGGVDSSTVLLLASLLHAGPVEAWTLAAPGHDSEDLDHAKMVCEHLGVPMRIVQPSEAELTEFYCARGVWMTETWEPALVRNAVSYHFLCRGVQAAGHKLCLSGEGADEVFGGYDYLRLLPEDQRDAAIYDSLSEVHRTYLQMADRAAMAATLEVRVPYMDREFVEHAAGMPAVARINGEQNKWALRHLYPQLLPSQTRLRPKLGMNAGAGYGSNDPGASIYHRAVLRHYAADPHGYTVDRELAGSHGVAFGVNLDDPEETFNFARFVELGYDRLRIRPRPQLNVSQLLTEPVEEFT